MSDALGGATLLVLVWIAWSLKRLADIMGEGRNDHADDRPSDHGGVDG